MKKVLQLLAIASLLTGTIAFTAQTLEERVSEEKLAAVVPMARYSQRYHHRL